MNRRSRVTRTITVLVLWTLSCGPAPARWPDGVLNYCGFEGVWDEAGWRDVGWAQGGTEGMSFDRQTKRFGKASLRVEGGEGETRTALQLNGNSIDPDTQYVLRVWVKTQDVHGEAALGLQPHAENEPLSFVDLGEAARLNGTHDWTLLEVQVPKLPSQAVRVHCYLWLKGTGIAWFDEHSLAKQGVPVPLGGQRPITDSDYAGVRFDDAQLPPNLLENSGFEEGLNRWYIENGKPVVDDAVQGGGTRSLRYDGTDQCTFTTVAVRVRIDPRRAYRLSVKLKTDLREGLSCVRVIPFKATGEGFGWWLSQDHVDEFCYGRGTQEWHEETVVLRQLQPETDFLNVYLELQDAVGTVWWDDVALTPLTLTETTKVRGQ